MIETVHGLLEIANETVLMKPPQTSPHIRGACCLFGPVTGFACEVKGKEQSQRHTPMDAFSVEPFPRKQCLV